MPLSSIRSRKLASALPVALQMLNFASHHPQAAWQTSGPRKRLLGTFARVLFKAVGLRKWTALEKEGLAGKFCLDFHTGARRVLNALAPKGPPPLLRTLFPGANAGAEKRLFSDLRV